MNRKRKLRSVIQEFNKWAQTYCFKDTCYRCEFVESADKVIAECRLICDEETGDDRLRNHIKMTVSKLYGERELDRITCAEWLVGRLERILDT